MSYGDPTTHHCLWSRNLGVVTPTPPGLTPMIGHSIREVETNRNIAANIKFIVLIMKSPSCAVVQTCFEITNNKQEANGGDDNRNKT